MSKLTEALEHLEQEGWQAPSRPQEVLTWETRIEPQLAAEMMLWFDQHNITVRSKSELLRLSIMLARDMLMEVGAIRPIMDLELSLEILRKAAIIQRDALRTVSKRGKMMGVLMGLERAEGTDVVLPKQFRQSERLAPIFPTEPAEPMVEGQVRHSIEVDMHRFEVMAKGEEIEQKIEEETKAYLSRERTSKEIEKAEEADKALALRKRFKKSMEINTDDVITENYHNCNQRRLELGRPSLHFQIYAIALKKGLKPEDIDQDVDFRDHFEYTNPAAASKYVDITKEPERREPTKEELRAAQLDAIQKAKAAKTEPVD